MLKNKTLVPVELDFTPAEFELVSQAAALAGQTIQVFIQDATRRATAPQCATLSFGPIPFLARVGDGSLL